MSAHADMRSRNEAHSLTMRRILCIWRDFFPHRIGLRTVRSIKIIGAGSIGNHIAFAARHRGWRVLMTDRDPAALQRARDEIYPMRYGSWDAQIETALTHDVTTEKADVIFVGTPPDTHIALALEALKVSPKILLVEKPICGPDLAGVEDMLQAAERQGVFAAVGYNHCLGKNTDYAEKLITERKLGDVLTISSQTREHWRGIFAAHPWIDGPAASYLGYASRGGGATGEHSHAINIWQHFAHVAGAGRVTEVSAKLDWVNDGTVAYDRAAFATLVTETGLVGDVIQDVVTSPTDKSARIQGSEGFLEWRVGYRAGADAVLSGRTGEPVAEYIIEKTRADDFIAEIDHLESILAGQVQHSPIALRRGLDTMMVIAAMFKSDKTGRRVAIDWSAGYSVKALS